MHTLTETKTPTSPGRHQTLRLCPLQAPAPASGLCWPGRLPRPPFPWLLTLGLTPPPTRWLPCPQEEPCRPGPASCPPSQLHTLASWLSAGAPQLSLRPQCILPAPPDDSCLAFKPCSGSTLKSHHHSPRLCNPTHNMPYFWARSWLSS